VVVRVVRRPGDSVDGTPATPVVQIASTLDPQVAAEATAEALSRIQSDEPAEVKTTGSSDPPLPARVLRVARAVDSATGSGEVRLALAGPAPAPMLGQGVEVRIAAGRHEQALTVPMKALRKGEAGTTEVVVVAGGKAAIRKVGTGLADGDRIEIVSGLSGGEAVVVEDPIGLEEGMDLEEQR